MTGSGTQADPYKIYNVTDLQAMENDPAAYYELANDIDASATVGWNDGEGFVPLGGGDNPKFPLPDGDVMSAGSWTLFPAGGTFASKVQTDDGDDSYIMAESNDCEVVFSVPISVPQTAQNIGIRVALRSRLVSAGTSVFKMLVRIGGVNYATSDVSRANTSYVSTMAGWSLNNPATGLPWTVDEVNGIGANSIEGLGVAVTDATPNVRFTYICATVSYENPFIGHFDGKGFAITDLFMDRPLPWIGGLVTMFAALFRVNAGTITGVALETCDITSAQLAGGIVETNEGNITNCHVTGTLGGTHAGGFVYENEGTISECYSNCEVTVTYYAAGFVNRNNGGTVSKCYSLGTVSGTKRAGGFVYYNFSGAMIQNCYSRCSADGDDRAGGFAVTNSAASTIDNCYSTGAVSGADIGGFCRGNYATITDCFWDIETSGTEISDGGTGKTTAEMKTESTFTDAGWDFTTPIWYINTTINDGYPAFIGVVRRIKGNPNIDQRIYQHIERIDR